ncbi:hypothetical protein H7J88_21465 [Mycolicibacterium flavescens]|uniref:hypothetical protein n=1 Tax=Mycolicibacterium flavescens TaxID=1776 RepID=UPI0021F2BDAB|nr:hypothetical protein [Mycolicibacterium flavescens]MCV7282204.1 hypothetical protein [Mycolicibacterium flavescens]
MVAGGSRWGVGTGLAVVVVDGVDRFCGPHWFVGGVGRRWAQIGLAVVLVDGVARLVGRARLIGKAGRRRAHLGIPVIPVDGICPVRVGGACWGCGGVGVEVAVAFGRFGGWVEGFLVVVGA